ncbi:MAG: GNAT family N-acetyltransferase [Candidatus Thorarchaeota archaeon]|nr:GNAT family N-acetyltransferase [Candidatus Thorarchaeota archaeon]
MKEDELEIVSGTVEDADVYVELFNASARYHGERDSRFHYASNLSDLTRNYYTEQCDSKDSWTGLAVLGKTVVGYISAVVRERGPIHEIRTIGFIEGLFVKPDVRGKGIGSQLWNKALDWLKEKNIGIIHLSVATENPLAFEFWRNKGFSQFMYQMEMNLG